MEQVLFAGTKYSLFDEMRAPGFAAPDYRIPSLLAQSGRVIAAIDSASGGMDWGKIAISVKVSEDDGDTWSEEKRVMTPPCGKAPVEDGDTTSAFVMDPVLIPAADKLIMVYDMFPESKGLHDQSRIVKTDGHCCIAGKTYLMLFVRGQSADKCKDRRTQTGYACHTLREDGWVYDPNGARTKYYSPLQHDPAYAYETIGDLYYGEGEFLQTPPPLYPENTKDIYVGNIYLNSDQPTLSDAPVRVVKRHYCEMYDTPETTAAPFCAAATCYLWQSESTDGGYTWSQPRDITPQVKHPRDGKFFGTGPGVGIRLAHQQDARKNGRLLVPLYALGKAAVIYSDDNGSSWQRGTTLYARNIDECQLAETADGSVFCFGRQLRLGKTPLSLSEDGGESFRRCRPCDPISVRCQKSVLMLPKNGENGFVYAEYMDPAKEYFVSAHPSGHHGKDSTRTDGVLSVCERDGMRMKTVKEIPLKDKQAYASFGEYSDFFAYSCCTLLSNGKIGVIREVYPSGCLVFSAVSL